MLFYLYDLRPSTTYGRILQGAFWLKNFQPSYPLLTNKYSSIF